jgi:hypothetical protein
MPKHDDSEKDFLQESVDLLDMLSDYSSSDKKKEITDVFNACDDSDEFAYYVGQLLYEKGLDEEKVMTFLKKIKKEWKKSSIGEEGELDSEEEKEKKEKDKDDNRKTAYYGHGGAEGGRNDMNGDLKRNNPEKRRGVKYENL